MHTFSRLVSVLLIGVPIFLGACSSTPVASDSQMASSPASGSTRKDTVIASATANPVAKSSIAAHLDPASLLVQRRSVFFDFDQSIVKSDFVPLLELHGKYLAANPTVTIKVEGNTDEQGGAEYNLALGQKRAEAVVSALKIYGAKDAQMEAVSFGEEKPREVGHEEAAYKTNRRADLVYPKK
jgi:peptidoglycan-associated lipoprotein